MIKLPIILAEHDSWQNAVNGAVFSRKSLEDAAKAETDYIRQIVLFQAQPRNQEATVEALFCGRIDQGRVLELVPLVFAEADAGDPVAAQLVARQVDEVVAMAGAAIRRLDLTGRDVDVVCGGGLFHGDAAAFIERIETGIRRIAPAARLTQVTAPPVVGAALLGLDRLGAPSGAAEHLRATLTHERLGALQPVVASNR